ncbi:MAG: serine/threonine protein kinase, partial [Acidobacteria bacterium]
MIGSRLGPYEILQMLGAGGNGEVYRAKDPRLKREVAIKVLSLESATDAERQKRLLHEAEAASGLNHPNILSIYDIGFENGNPYIVSELVEGESLRKVIQRGTVTVKKLLDIATQITDAMAAAHQAGIIHRDLKPENIMVTGEGRVKILDFGLAKEWIPKVGSAQEQTISAVVTESGIILGTVRYMSPEQATAGNIDFRSDQFSCGTILYEMATGRHPFARKTNVETLAAIVSEDPEHLGTA